MDSNHRCLDVRQESSPLDHGIINSSPYGNRTHPSSLRGWCPSPIDERAVQCVGQELNLHSAARVGYSHLGSPMPSRRMTSSTGGIEPTDDHQGLSLAALPVCVPCRLSPSAQRPASLAGFEPAVSTVTGWRGRPLPYRDEFRGEPSSVSCRVTRQLTLLGSPMITVGARGIEPRYSCSQGTRITGFLDAVQFGEKESNLHHLGQGQAAYRLADPRIHGQPIVTQVRGEGVEPSSPASKTGSLPLADLRSLAVGSRQWAEKPTINCLLLTACQLPLPTAYCQLQGWESNPQPSG